MKKSFFRNISMIAASILLVGAVGFGFFTSIKLQQYAETEKNFFTQSVLDQSSSLNRVVFAMEEYSAYPGHGSLEPGWMDKKLELCRSLVSQASIPPFIDPATYSALVTDDPLLLAGRLEESNRKYRTVLEALTGCYTRMPDAGNESAMVSLFSEFDGLYREFRAVVKERSSVMTMIESTYHSRLRSGITTTVEIRNQVFIGQTIAVLASLMLIFITFLSQMRRLKVLQGLIPICVKCKKIRDDKGYWSQVETYIHEHSEADFTHGMCPDCIRDMYPQYLDKDTEQVSSPIK